MVKQKAFFTTVRRTIKSNLSLILSMIAIITLGVGFITGLFATSPNMQDSMNGYLKQSVVPDIIIKAPAGISQTQRDSILSDSNIQAEELLSFDTSVSEMITRLYYLPLDNRSVNKIELVSGRMPKNDTEVLAERDSQGIKPLELDCILDYNGMPLKVVGIAANPLYFSKEKEPSMTEGEHLEAIIYFDSAFFSFNPVSDVYISLNNVQDLNAFGSKYEEKVNDAIAKLKTLEEADKPLIFLTLRENVSFMLFKGSVEKLSIISYIFPVFFILVAALVVLTTMTRIIEKERAVIGCYRTLGYGKGLIVLKYLAYATICCLLGTAAGLLSGFRILPEIIYNTYDAVFYLPALKFGFYFWGGIISAILMTAAVVTVAVYVVLKSLKEHPAGLLKQKAPPKGKKIFLEKITFIWKRLKFKYKSTFRNIFRYIKHLIMTVISIAGCTALVFAAFSLNDSVNNTQTSGFLNPEAFERFASSISFVILIIIIAAAALSIIVNFNLTNINIEERKKELATLKVLGYKNTEVLGYIFREMIVYSILGIIPGLPAGYILLKFVLSFMSSGSFAISLYVNWYTWFLTAFTTMAFTCLVILLLFRKIIKTDMNASLKAFD